MMYSKLTVQVTKTRQGDSDYLQILSDDQFAVNIVLIAPQIVVSDDRPKTKKEERGWMMATKIEWVPYALNFSVKGTTKEVVLTFHLPEMPKGSAIQDILFHGLEANQERQAEIRIDVPDDESTCPECGRGPEECLLAEQRRHDAVGRWKGIAEHQKTIQDIVAEVTNIQRNVAHAVRWLARCDKVFPKIVCLCGSTRFASTFFEKGWELTLQGIIVLSIGVTKHTDADGGHGAESLGPETVKLIDELHLRKIDLADEVLVLNVDGYVGQSTTKEIRYAIATGKNVSFLEPVTVERWNQIVNGPMPWEAGAQ